MRAMAGWKAYPCAAGESIHSNPLRTTFNHHYRWWSIQISPVFYSPPTLVGSRTCEPVTPSGRFNAIGPRGTVLILCHSERTGGISDLTFRCFNEDASPSRHRAVLNH